MFIREAGDREAYKRFGLRREGNYLYGPDDQLEAYRAYMTSRQDDA